jgi:hypothetical protein
MVTGPGVNCCTDCAESVTSGTPVTLTATPASGSVFTGWSGGGCTGTGTCTTTVLANTTVTATFGQPTYTLTVARSGTGSGMVTGPGVNCGTDCAESVTSGTPVTSPPRLPMGPSSWAGAEPAVVQVPVA